MNSFEKKIATSVLGFSLWNSPAWARELSDAELAEISVAVGVQQTAFFRPSVSMETSRDSFSWSSASEVDHLETHDRDRRSVDHHSQQQRRAAEVRARQLNTRNTYSGDNRNYRYRGSSSATTTSNNSAAQSRSGYVGR